MPKQRPRPQARGLAARLLEMRKATGLSSTEVAAKLGWSQSTVSRIETGKRVVKPEEVIALLATYGVRGDDREQLLEMSRHGDRPNWLEELRGKAVPVQASMLAEYESEAIAITHVDLLLISGLLQTRAYTNAVMRADGVPATEIEPRVALRVERQKLLHRRPPIRLLSILDEAALRREVGGRQVMADQLEQLIASAERPNVEVRVVPFDRGGHAASTASYALMEFSGGPPLVHVEMRGGGVFLDDGGHIDAYVNVTANMKAIALEQHESLRLIAGIAAGYRRE
ncbi:helix-turn-helix domain-containing protein [Fodinicola acaciae]|uniref:helix-turn-helix domain-containing protein n=1 Tax=Fodinicola acaciae TaxID=2681555 RepID=UPI0013D36F04|nr:helix-turn-helix transcriptional regulator [Fodinicola acaciae]